jgi:23S rRNA (uracil1939-C5)-methyltransferase
MEYKKELQDKEHYVYISLTKYCNDKTIKKSIIGSPLDKFYANKINIDINNIDDIEKNTISNKIIISTAIVIKKWLLNYSKLKIYDHKIYQGFWRIIGIKSNKENDIMLKITIFDDGKNNDLWNDEKDLLIQYLLDNNISLKLIFLQTTNKKEINAKDDKLDIIYDIDNKYGIYETILNTKFFITPNSFSQANESTVDLLYNTIDNIIIENLQNKLIGYGRNIGHIIFPIINNFKKVQLYNPCHIVHTNLLQTITINNINTNNLVLTHDQKCSLISFDIKNENDKFTLVVSPGRTGLKDNVIESIVKTNNITKIIYVSCNIVSFIKNMEKLKDYFIISKIIPIDIFPGTKYCEIIIEIIPKNNE